VRAADAKQRLTFLLNRAACIDIHVGQFERALVRSSEALELAQLMERPSEILLARINIQLIGQRGSEAGGEANLVSIAELSAGTVAQWARERAAALLSEQA